MMERRCFWEFSSGIGRGMKRQDRTMYNLIEKDFHF